MLEIPLDNAAMIQQANSMFACEMEPLYWKVEDMLHDGHKQEASNIFVILLYAAKYNPGLISAGLKPGHRMRLKELSYEFFSDSVPSINQAIEIRSSVSPQNIVFKKELELQTYLFSNPEVLGRALGDDLKVACEVEVGPNYKCDIVADGKRMYAIELKIGQTTHAVVSQCVKYCYYLRRKLRYGWYKEVQGVVIGNGFDDWSINELRRVGIWIFAIQPDGDAGIRLVRIH